MIKKIKLYGLLSLGIVSSAISYKLLKEEEAKPIKRMGIIIKEDNFFTNYKKKYDNKTTVYYNEKEQFEEIKKPIIIGMKLKPNEKVYYYSKKMSK